MNPKYDMRQLAKMVKNQEISPEEALSLYKDSQKSKQGSLFSTKNSHSVLYYSSEWIEQELFQQEEKKHSYPQTIVLFDHDEQIFSKLNLQFKQANGAVNHLILVKAGRSFRKISDNILEINPKNEADYGVLFKFFQQSNIVPTTLVHAWSNITYQNDSATLHRQLEHSIYSMFFLSKAISEFFARQHVDLFYMFNSSQEGMQPLYAAVSGFLKSVQKENRFIHGKTVEICSEEPHVFVNSIWSLLWKEWTNPDSTSSEILYKDGRRYVRKMKEYKDEPIVGSPSFRDKGTYLITGGMNGIGYIFAEYLAQEYQAKLVLSGRSKLSTDIESKLSKLREYGAEALYIEGNISERQDVQHLIATAKKTFGTIDGILHSAGIHRDSLTVNKNLSDLQEVMSPKVLGAIHLEELTKDEELDFLIFFSSLAGLMGNSGQSDYAFANRFMDNLAYHQRKQSGSMRLLSINWPLWQEGGMMVDDQTKELFTHTLGLSLLSRKEGIGALQVMLRASLSHLLVISGNEQKIKPLIMDGTFANDSVALQSRQENERLVDHKIVMRKLEKDIIDIICTILNTTKDRIDMDSELSVFGFDSISLTQLSNQINSKFKLQLMPSIFYEYSTIKTLVQHLLEEYQEKFEEIYGESIYQSVPKRALPEELHKNREKKDVQSSLKFKRSQKNSGVSSANLNDAREPIAIIGMSGMMPQSEDLEAFWEHLEQGNDLITEIPKDRWDWREYYGNPMSEGNKTFAKFGGFMKEVDKFDPLFFGISPSEAELMDPQQRLFLQTVWKTVEDAGYKASDLSGTKTSLFVGVATQDYNELLKQKTPFLKPQSLTGMTHSVLANRISYLLNIHGPSQPVDTACSSALIALHQAVESILSGGCEMAIAGGINVMLTPTLHISESKAGMLSPDGRCKTFDKSANGYVRGEGVGAVLLKPLRKAVQDGDHIYALIKGTAVNHGGRANSLTAPNPNAQAELLVEAYQKASIDPSTVTYIETHGTGTSLGDPVEINGLKKAFKTLFQQSHQELPNEPYCWLGSVKTNIGHLETAAGMAGLLKVLLAMKYKKIPASLHLRELNPYIQIENTPFCIAKETIPWTALTDNDQIIPRRAGVSSFGFGGSNAHIVLEEYIPSEQVFEAEQTEPQLMILSAKNKERLKEYAKTTINFLKKQEKEWTNENSVEKIELALQENLLELVSNIIHVSTEEIAVGDDLFDYGLDAVHLSELVNQISQNFQVEIKSNLFLECTSIQALAQKLVFLFPEQFAFLQKYLSSGMRSSGEYSVSLRNMAYTLQVGREEMEERLAIVAYSFKEFAEKLTHFIKGDYEIEGLSVGSVKNNKNISSYLVEGREGIEFLQIIIQDRKLDKLGKLWVSGVEVDWKVLHQYHEVKRISLPTYPFSNERFWIPEETVPMKTDTKYLEKKIHPLIDENISTFSQLQFTSSMTGNEYFLRDHVINREKLLPGVAYLEMARVAGELAGKRTVRTIKNMVWSQPLKVKEEEKQVYVTLHPNDGQVHWEITTVDQDNQKILHAQGKLQYGEERLEPDEQIDLSSIRKRCHVSLTKQECYRSFEDQGFKYGSTLQSISEIVGNKGEALSSLVLPMELEDGFSQYVLHPAMMDGALQTVKGLVGGETLLDSNLFYLPFSVGEITLVRPLEKNCYAYVKESESSDSSIKKFTILIVNQSGQLLVKMKDFAVRALKAEREQPKSTNTFYYYPEWQGAISTDHRNENSFTQPILLLTNQKEVLHAVQRQVKSQVVMVRASTSYKKENALSYQINPGDAEHFSQLLEDLEHDQLMPEHVIHLWSYDYQGKELAEQLEIGVYTLVNIYKAFNAQKVKSRVNLIYGYEQLNKSVSAFHGANYGFVKSAQLEVPFIRPKIIEILPSSMEVDKDSLVKMLLTELSLEDESTLIRYTDYQRFVKKYKKMEPDDRPLAVESIRRNGTYLITGGAGGIGFIFAQYLAQAAQARVVLAGRSTLNPEINGRLNKLRASGADIAYYPCDVSSLEEVKKLIKRVKESHGEINGVIHSAGLIKDSLIIKKKKHEMDAVLESKVQGTIHLDQATAKENLDFFILFSSVSAVLGNLGQSDYAYANCFLDHFAELRQEQVKDGIRKGKTLSINWPLWKEGGMKVNELTVDQMEKRYGVTSLDSESGIYALLKALSSLTTQMLVLSGNNDQVAQNIGLPTLAETGDFVIQGRRGGQDSERELAQIETSILKLCAELLKLNEHEIDVEEDLSDYGVDSVMMITLLNRLEEKIGQPLEANSIVEHKSIKGLSKYIYLNFRGGEIEIGTNVRESITNFHLSEEKAVPTESLFSQVTKDITALCAELLKISEATFDLDDELSEYGVDSVMMMTLLNRLEERYKKVIEPNTIVENNTISKLVTYLIENEIAVKSEMELEKSDGNSRSNQAVVTIPENTFSTPEHTFSMNHSLQKNKQKIAVIGMATRFPQSPNLKAYWENIRNGINLISEVKRDRWKLEEYFDTDKQAENKSYSKWGGFIDDIYDFDPEYFGINETDALVMDPQHRILIELAEDLFGNAGYRKEEVSGSRTGVFLGAGASSYVKINDPSLSDEYLKRVIVNSIPNMMAARISDFYNLKGTSQTIDTACSSSLVAIHQACKSLLDGELEMAICGGIELLLDPSVFIGYSKAGVLSDDGICYVFDEKAKGFVLGEGAGLVLLKPYDQAVEDGDRIFGVIAGTAVNNDGQTMGLTVPNMEGQKEVIERALAVSGVGPESITYLEAHGTGTLLGDPIEIRAATQVYQQYTDETQYCAVGSVKSNMGHLARAAGIASFIKVMLSLHYKEIPATLNCTRPHPRFKFEDSPFYPVMKTKPWEIHNRKAAISSFGFGGTNCHMIVEEFVPEEEGSYRKLREELPKVQFNRKKYYLGTQSSPVTKRNSSQDDFDGKFYLEILDKLEVGSIKSEEALQKMMEHDEHFLP